VAAKQVSYLVAGEAFGGETQCPCNPIRNRVARGVTEYEPGRLLGVVSEGEGCLQVRTLYDFGAIHHSVDGRHA
jgi:hypothetical protein